MNMKHPTTCKQVALSLDVKAGDAPGTFEGYGAVFGNRDRDGDMVAPGAFAESLKAGMPVLLWQHDQKAPIGRFDEVREDAKGLFVKGRLSLSGRGAEAYDLMKMGALDGLSIGFVTKEASRDAVTGTRTITKADLMEVSLVTFPANDLARVSAVKSQQFADGSPAADPRAFERLLRDNGFSRSRAKAITAKGFRAVDVEALEHAEIIEMVRTLKAGQLRLEDKTPCKDGCTDCEPCRKDRNTGPDCEYRKNDIIDGNRARWKSWQKVTDTTKKCLVAIKKFEEKYEESMVRSLVFNSVSMSISAIETGVAAVRRNPVAVRRALYDAGEKLLDSFDIIFNYNGRHKREFLAAIAPYQVEVNRSMREAQANEETFQQQIKNYTAAGCSGLHGGHFNRP